MLACESALVSSTAAAQPGHAGALSDAGTPRGMQIALQLQPFSNLPSGHHESVRSGGEAVSAGEESEAVHSVREFRPSAGGSRPPRLPTGAALPQQPSLEVGQGAGAAGAALAAPRGDLAGTSGSAALPRRVVPPTGALAAFMAAPMPQLPTTSERLEDEEHHAASAWQCPMCGAQVKFSARVNITAATLELDPSAIKLAAHQRTSHKGRGAEFRRHLGRLCPKFEGGYALCTSCGDCFGGSIRGGQCGKCRDHGTMSVGSLTPGQVQRRQPAAVAARLSATAARGTGDRQPASGAATTRALLPPQRARTAGQQAAWEALERQHLLGLEQQQNDAAAQRQQQQRQQQRDQQQAERAAALARQQEQQQLLQQASARAAATSLAAEAAALLVSQQQQPAALAQLQQQAVHAAEVAQAAAQALQQQLDGEQQQREALQQQREAEELAQQKQQEAEELAQQQHQLEQDQQLAALAEAEVQLALQRQHEQEAAALAQQQQQVLEAAQAAEAAALLALQQQQQAAAHEPGALQTEDGFPLWTVDTPAVAAALDAVNLQHLTTMVLSTTKHLARDPCHKRGSRALTQKAGKLYEHSIVQLLRAVEAPVSAAQQLRARRASILHYIMPALLATGATGITCGHRLSCIWRGEIKLQIVHLMARARVPTERGSKPPTPEQRAAQISALMQEQGGRRKVIQKLLPMERAVVNEACQQLMQQKHPAAPPGESMPELLAMAGLLHQQSDDVGLPADALAQQAASFEPATLTSRLRKLDPQKASGPNGSTGRHLREYANTLGGRETFGPLLSQLFRAMMYSASSFPKLFWTLICGSRLAPTAEKLLDGSTKYRPLAIGDTLLRLMSSIIMQENGQRFAETLRQGGQLAVGTAAAAERSATATALDFQAGLHTLQLDIKNAFPSISRKAVLLAIAKHHPDLLGFFTQTYLNSDAHMLLCLDNGAVDDITHTTGIRQGDAMATTWFALGQHECLVSYNAAAEQQESPRRASSYADDTKIAVGSGIFSQQLLDSFVQLQADFKAVNLELQVAKSFALPGAGVIVSAAEQQRLQQSGFTLQGGAVGDHRRGFITLGVPVGNTEYQQQQLMLKVAPHSKVMAAAEAVMSLPLPSPKTSFCLLTSCVIPMLSYAARTTPPELALAAFTEFDTATQYHAERIMGLQPREVTYQQATSGGGPPPLRLSAAAVAQLRMPTRAGGAGVSSVVEASQPAFVAAMAAVLPSVLSDQAAISEQHAEALSDPLDLPLLRSLKLAVAGLSEKLGGDLPMGCTQLALQSYAAGALGHPLLHRAAVEQEGPIYQAQRTLAGAASKAAWKNLLAAVNDTPDSTIREQEMARLKSLHMPGSLGTTWLSYGLYTTAFDGIMWQLALSRLLGFEKRTAVCNACGKQQGGTIHARWCQAPDSMAGQVTVVHNIVRDELGAILEQCTGFKAAAEAHDCFLAGEDPAFRMDQLTLPGAFAAVAVSNPSYGKRIMVDVSFIEEQSASHRTQAAEQGPLQALEDRENTKKVRYQGSFDPGCFLLRTVAVGSFGAVGPQGHELIDAMATQYVARRGFAGVAAAAEYKSSAMAMIRGRLSVSLQMALSARVLKYLSVPFAGAEAAGAGEYGLWDID